MFYIDEIRCNKQFPLLTNVNEIPNIAPVSTV